MTLKLDDSLKIPGHCRTIEYAGATLSVRAYDANKRSGSVLVVLEVYGQVALLNVPRCTETALSTRIEQAASLFFATVVLRRGAREKATVEPPR